MILITFSLKLQNQQLSNVKCKKGPVCRKKSRRKSNIYNRNCEKISREVHKMAKKVNRNPYDLDLRHRNYIQKRFVKQVLKLINCLLYADDIALVSSTEEGLQHCIDRLHSYCKTWNLTINIKKTKVLIFNKCGRIMKNNVFNIENEKLQVVKEMKYLGIVFNSNCIFRTTNMKTLKTKVLKLCLDCLNPLEILPRYQNIYSFIRLNDKTYIIIQL